MRIACLQFSPQVGKVRENIARASALLQGYSPGDFEVLVLPEMAFSGYNFTSLDAITPYLEPTSAGPTAQWAKATAARLRCVVSVGYPEIDSGGGPLSAGPGTAAAPLPMTFPPPAAPPVTSPPPTAPPLPPPSSSYPRYNSTITVSPQGDILAHYRKTHLYYTDETWAQESPTGWLTLPLTLPFPSPSPAPTQTTFGICMDINPHQLTASWTLHEFATHALASSAHLLILSMAWLTTLPSTALRGPAAQEPDHDTWAYWCARLEPLVRQTERKVVVVVANRCGEEGPEARYAGTSWVGALGGGEIRRWGVAGRGEERVLVVDTERGGGRVWRFK